MQADDAPPPPPPDKKCMYYCRVLLGLLASCILLLGVSMQVHSGLDLLWLVQFPSFCLICTCTEPESTQGFRKKHKIVQGCFKAMRDLFSAAKLAEI